MTAGVIRWCSACAETLLLAGAMGHNRTMEHQSAVLGQPYDNASVASRLGGEPIELSARGHVFSGFRASPTGTSAAGGAEEEAPSNRVHATRLPVLLVHGWPEFAAGWEETAARLLQAGYEIAAFDQRGYSAGARPDEVAAYDVAELRADVDGVADALGFERFHFVGHDWGGVVGWAYAAAHPERLASVTIVSTAHPEAHARRIAADPDQKVRMGYMASIRRDAARVREIMLADDGRKLRETYQGAVPAGLVDSYVERFSAPGVMDAVLAYYQQFGEGEPIAYRPITVPTLYIWGSEDVAFTRGAAELSADYVEGEYRFAELAGASHWLPEERPADVAAEVLAWIAAHPA